MIQYKFTLIVLFACISFITKQGLANSTADAINIIDARHRQKSSFIDKTISSEKHRKQQDQRRLSTEYLDKKVSKLSWQDHRRIFKIVIRGNKSISTKELQDVVEPYLKKRITKKRLKIIKEKIENYYYKSGYLLPIANVKIHNSVLKINVIEGKIKNVLVIFVDEKRDKKALKNQRFLDLIKKIETAKSIKTKDLERYVLLINKIHGYTVNYELEGFNPPEGDNVANLLMQIETKRGAGEISLDNKGNSDLGKYQLDVGGQIFNPIANDSLMFSANTSNKPKKVQQITVGYLKRLNSYGTSASVLGSYARDDSTRSNGSKYSVSTNLKGTISHYVVLNNDNSFKLEISADASDIDQYSGRTQTRDYKYTLGSIGGKIKITDPLDVENWFFPYYKWTVNKVSYSKNSQLERNFDKNFNYFALDYYRNQPLPKDFSLFLKASYQTTNKLLPLEHIYSIGTHNTARGYDIGMVSSDQGISGMAELRYTKSFSKPKIKKFINDGQIFAFYDVTHFIKHNKDAVRRKHSDAVYFNKSTLPSFGLGLRLFFAHGFFAEGTAEYPTVKNITIDEVKRKNTVIHRFLLSKEFNW